MTNLLTPSHSAAHLMLSVLVLLVSGCSGCDDAGAQGAWFSAEDLMENLRQADQDRAESLVDPLTLEQLPLYDMAITVADDQSSFTMTEEVYYTNTTGDELESVVLRLYANAVGDSPQVRLTGSECVGAECQVRWDQGSTFEVRPSSPLADGDRLRIRLELEGDLQEIEAARTNMLSQAMEGLQRQGSGAGASHGDYGLLAHGSGIASLGNFYAMVAPYRDGDWVRSDGSTMGDLGADSLCHFRATIRSKSGSNVAVTGAITLDETHLSRGDTPGFQETRVVAAMVRNFGIVLGEDLQVATEQVGDIEVRSWFLGSDRARGMAALDAAKESLVVFERRFGAYPYTDFELAEAPLVGGAGGVEFSGLVTIAQMFYGSMAGGGGGLSALLGGGSVGNIMDSMLEFVVAHEVAHQWWHGIVGSDARLHPFVDESLAQFSAMLYMEDRYGEARAEQEGLRQVAGNYHMMRAQGGADAAVDQPASAFANEVAYAGIVYGKGPYLYSALRELVGDDAFFAALSGYVDEYRFGVAPPRALIDRLATGSHEAGVRSLEQRWLEQTHGDEDLGRPSMQGMMQAWTGQNTGGLNGLLEQLQNVQGGLQGLGGGSGSGGAAGPGGDLEEQIRMLEEATRRLQEL